MEDTQWNDVLIKKGIIKKPESKEEEIKEENLKHKSVDENIDVNLEDDLNLDRLDELDEDDERAFLAYRNKRLAEMLIENSKARFGEVIEISRQDYLDEVNKAGQDVWVVLHVYQLGNTLCSLINEYLNILAMKFPRTKFIKSIVSLCIPNFPENNLPAIFVYLDGQIKKQIIGQHKFGGVKLKLNELEWIISKTGAIQTDLESDPRIKPTKESKIFTVVKENDDDGSDDEW